MLHIKIIAIFVCILISPILSFAQSNELEVKINNGTININISTMSEETKNALIINVISDEITRIGDNEFLSENYNSAMALFVSALNINPNNLSAFKKMNETMLALGNKNTDFDAYNLLLNQANNMFESNSMNNSIVCEKKNILYTMALSFCSPESAEYKRTSELITLNNECLAKGPSNSINTKVNADLMKKLADDSYTKKHYIEAIQHYSASYEALNDIYCLKKIADVIEMIDKKKK